MYHFKHPLIHDGRKPLDRWVASQLSYSALEARRIASRSSYRFRDRLRELGVMPVIAGALAYVRAAYESLLAIRLMSAKLEHEGKSATEPVSLQTPEVSDPEPK